MIFSIIILLLVGVISYFYYAQGFFTSLLTAICATVAAVVAVSYHENLADMAFKSALTDEGAAFSLVLLFAITFAILRITLDSAVPGNIHLPLLMDRIGAGVFGLISAIFATGIFAIAIQTLPFGPTIMGQSRFKTLGARSVQIPNTGAQAVDSQVADELSSEQLNDEDRQSLWMPVDQWVLGFVSSLSDGGSLAGDRTLASVHPNYLDELFAQRLGIQPGARHTAVNVPGHEQVTVSLAYTVPELAEADGEIPQLRNGALKLVKPTIKSEGSNVILVIRAMFTSVAADTDKYFRFGTGSMRLVANGKSYYPLGTLDSGSVLRVNKPDDPLFVPGDSGADLVFDVPKSDVLKGDTITKKPGGKQAESFGGFVPGVFLEVKRMARIDLADVKLGPQQAEDETVNVLRKKGIPDPKATVSAAPADMGNDSPFVFDHMDISPKIFTPIAVGLIDGDNATVTLPSGSGTAQVRSKATFAKLTLNPVVALADLSKGDNAIDQLFVPPGMKAVQLVGALPPKANDPWTWAEHLGDFSVTDADGKPYKPSGAMARVMKSIQPMAVGAYDSDAGVASIPAAAEVRPTDVWLIFMVPDSANLKELDYQGKRLAPLNAAVGG